MKKTLQTLRYYFNSMDKGLLFAVLICSFISCLMLYSMAVNELMGEIGMGSFRTQLAASVLGVITVFALSATDYNRIIRLWYVYGPIALGLVLLTFTPLGYKRSGADDQAWLRIAGFNLQPSEILKLAFILTFSYHLAKDEENMNKLPHMLLLCLHGAIPMGLVALQGDYGTAIIFAAIFMAQLLSSRIYLRYILAAAAAIPAACAAAWFFLLGDTHKARILVLFHPGTDPENLEYQQDLGLSALAKGKIFGLGLSAGEDTYVNVPEMHNDFIFSYVGQALGMLGALLVMLLLSFICLKVLTDSMASKNSQGRFICTGIFGMLFAHCFMNIGMVLKVMPVIGIPLPFFSAGGTAVVCMYTAIGLVNSTRCHNTRKYRVFYDAEEDSGKRK